jgi:hypothetical protein
MEEEMSPHSLIAGLCFFLMLAVILVAMFRSVADTDKRAPKQSQRPEFFKCLACGVFESTDGHQQFEPPYSNIEIGKGHVVIRGYRVRECTECRAAQLALIKAGKAPLLK